MAERCPRCGEELKFGKTPALKVCHDCPTCGGRLVTLPILKDGLGDKGVALLTRSVRTMAADGCVCPSCGKRMAILKVEVDGRKIEIDVCATCLSVWCDYGEFEALVPARAPKLGEMSMRELVSRASPEAQAHLQEALIESIPTEGVDFCDYNLNDVLLDVVRLLAGLRRFGKRFVSQRRSSRYCSRLQFRLCRVFSAMILRRTTNISDVVISGLSAIRSREASVSPLRISFLISPSRSCKFPVGLRL